MSKLRTLILILLAAVLCPLIFTGQSPHAGASDISPNPEISQVADLKKLLEAGLKARRPQEFAFISRVVDLVY